MSDEQTVTAEEFQKDLETWYAMQVNLENLKAAEMSLRKKIFGVAFPTPKEGTNDYKLSEGFVLKGTYKITRNVDEAILAVKASELEAEGIPVKDLIKQKPELVTKAYRSLTTEQRLKFDQVLDIKPGSPAMEIVRPKR